MNLVSCKDYARQRKQELKQEISTLEEKPCLVVIQIDHNPASDAYVRGKGKDCEEVGITMEHMNIESEDFTQEALEVMVSDVSSKDSVHGIIIQLPIPDKYNLDRLLSLIPPEKDVDGFRRDSLFKPCTPRGIMNWLAFNQYNLTGKNVTVLGRSKIVGKPMVEMLIDAGATVTCCNSHTKDLYDHTRKADMVVSAIGKAEFINKLYFDKTAHMPEVIVDVGINRDSDGYLCGDVNIDDLDFYLSETYITPVPGGVGLLTRLALLENTYEAYKNLMEELV